jgi:hypothetical protein
VSRARPQRLVSLCLAERLIVPAEHPIAACMELAASDGLVSSHLLRSRADRSRCTAFGDRELPSGPRAFWDRRCAPRSPRSALGTGRAVRAAVERVSPIGESPDRIAGRNISARLGELLRRSGGLQTCPGAALSQRCVS